MIALFSWLAVPMALFFGAIFTILFFKNWLVSLTYMTGVQFTDYLNSLSSYITIPLGYLANFVNTDLIFGLLFSIIFCEISYGLMRLAKMTLSFLLQGK